MSVARFIADQRTKYRVPHTITCVLLGVSVSWFYKWITRVGDRDGVHTDAARRDAQGRQRDGEDDRADRRRTEVVACH